MDALLDFCAAHNILLSFSPQAVNNWPRYELLTSPEYRALIERAIKLKKRGTPILGSTVYLKTLLEQTPYACYPTITPRITPDGWLIYPCLPMEKDGSAQGGRHKTVPQDGALPAPAALPRARKLIASLTPWGAA